MNRILAPSVLSADFSRLGEEVRATEENGAQYLHLDVMDGIFVPSISFGLPVIRTLRPCSRQIFDVHLMITEPDRYVADFAEAGAEAVRTGDPGEDLVAVAVDYKKERTANIRGRCDGHRKHGETPPNGE